MQFRNYYECAKCGREWTDVWLAQCDDDCPQCGARHMSPYKSEDVSDDDVGRAQVNSAAPKKSDAIRILNDAFRTTFVGGRVVMTASVGALVPELRAQLIRKVQAFA